MTSIKDDLVEIINEDLDRVRTRFNRIRRGLPDILRNPLDTCDDLIARWSGKSTPPRQKKRIGRNSDRDELP